LVDKAPTESLMRPYIVSLLSLILLVSGLSLTGRAGPASSACGDSGIRIRDASPAEAVLACAGIADARAFFAAHGLAADIDIDITVQPRVDAGDTVDLAFPVLGQYRPEANRVFMTALEAQRDMSEDTPVFGVPFEPMQFREVVAHEVVHALAEQNFIRDEPSRLVHEYIAYIVQMATMAPDRRARILAAYSATPFRSAEEINPIVYAIAPDMFAVKAYLYFAAQPDGAAYLRRLLADDLPAANLTFDLFG
jgi:hypothetical protein